MERLPSIDKQAHDEENCSSHISGNSKNQKQASQEEHSTTEVKGSRTGTEHMPFRGMRFIILGSSSEEQRMECKSKILNLGGTLVQSSQYDLATHILTLDDIAEGATTLWRIEGKKVVSSAWIDGFQHLSGSGFSTPTSNNAQRAVISTSKRKRCCIERNVASQRNLFPKESENGKFHHWLHCVLDTSDIITLQQFTNENKDSIIQLVPTPGSAQHISILAASEVKLYSRKSYLAMAAMHLDGITMRGDFGASNFLIDRAKSVKIGNLREGALKEITSEDDVKLDKEGFVSMIKNELLLGKSIPDGIFEWMSLLLKGEPLELLSCHIGLLEDFLGGHILMTL